MNNDYATKIINCRNKIRANNIELRRISKENVRLFTSLMSMMITVSPEQKKRYDKELSSDNWKKTNYYRINMSKPTE